MNSTRFEVNRVIQSHHGQRVHLRPDRRKGACQGDSGGPALVDTPAGMRVAGITSFGDPDCTKVGASVRVSPVYASSSRPSSARAPRALSCDDCALASVGPGNACVSQSTACATTTTACGKFLTLRRRVHDLGVRHAVPAQQPGGRDGVQRRRRPVSAAVLRRRARTAPSCGGTGGAGGAGTSWHGRRGRRRHDGRARRASGRARRGHRRGPHLPTSPTRARLPDVHAGHLLHAGRSPAPTTRRAAPATPRRLRRPAGSTPRSRQALAVPRQLPGRAVRDGRRRRHGGGTTGTVGGTRRRWHDGPDGRQLGLPRRSAARAPAARSRLLALASAAAAEALARGRSLGRGVVRMPTSNPTSTSGGAAEARRA